jgi:hypothetical protein
MIEETAANRPVFSAFVDAATASLTTKERRGGGACDVDGWRFEVLVLRPPKDSLAKTIPHSPYFWGTRVQVIQRVDLLAPVTRGLYDEDFVDDAAKGWLFRHWSAAEAMVRPILDLPAPLVTYGRPRYFWAPETWRKDVTDLFFKKAGRWMQMHWCIATHTLPGLVHL